MYTKFINQAKRGLDLATDSFNLLWQHKKLVAYLAIPAIVGIITELIAYNILVGPDTQTLSLFSGFDDLIVFITESPQWIWTIIKYLCLFLFIYFVFFFNAGLIHHTMHILQHETTSVLESLIALRTKIYTLAAWALISTVVLVLLQKLLLMPTANYQMITLAFGLVLNITWSLATLFVLPIITIEPKTIIEAILKSWTILKHYLITTLAGQAWIGFMALVAAGPFFLPRIFLSYNGYGSYILVATSLALIVVRYTIATVNTIFKTTIYDEFTTPEREMRRINYPSL